MTLFIDAHFTPSLAPWIIENFGIKSYSFDFKGWRTTSDLAVFQATKKVEDSVILTKDEDFVSLLSALKPPPKIIWVTVGNTSNQNMRKVLSAKLRDAVDLLKSNDLIEIKD